MLTIVGICMLIAGAIGIFSSILLAFVWRVPDLLDELSGRKAKRQIQRLRELNIGTGGIEGISTNELYEMINNSGNLVWKNVGEVEDNDNDIEENDNTNKEKQDGYEEDSSVSFEDATLVSSSKGEESHPLENTCDEESEFVITKNVTRKVVVIEEQSSVILEVQNDEE